MSAQSESRPFQSQLFLLVLALFFASGFSSLIYQVVWTRHLVLIFGSTTFATATVLAVFMGGLALGSFLAGRVADRIAKPFLWYGILEGIIGLWALAVPILLDIAVSSYRVIWELTHFDFFSFSLLRLGLAAMILLVPTTLMGATLPLLSKYVADSLSTVGNRIGTIYAINTLGAVCGAVQSGLFLLPGLGLSVTTMIAAGINVFLCLIVIWISYRLENLANRVAVETAESDTAKSDANESNVETRKSKKKKKGKKANEAEVSNLETQKEETPKQEAEQTKAKVPGRVYAALAAIAISGGAAMIYEVCWTRTLSMVIGGSTYAFTVMLSTFLSGIFLGSFFCAKVVDKFKQPFLAFGVFQIFVATGCLTSLLLCQFLPMWNLRLNDLFPNALFPIFIRFILAETALLPLTLFLGALFPIVIKCTASDIEHIASSVGTVYSANTLGAIVGSVMAGFVLIPQFGVEKTIIIATGVNMMVGAVMIFLQTEAKTSQKIGYAAMGAIIFVAFLFNPITTDKRTLLFSQSARRALRDGYDVFSANAPWRQTTERTKLVYYKDGPCSNVAVLLFAQGDKVGTYSLLTNGCVDASDGADMSQQVLLASYPMLFRPHARRACIVGWGSGVTVAELLNFPVNSVTAVELEPAVIEAAKVFDKYTHEPEKNPRVKVEINDGRNFLLATTQKFDIIISEPSNPWQVGVCNLFTKEYFHCVKDRLTPDGVLSLWLQLGEVSPESIKAVLSALNSEFPYCLAMASDRSNLAVLASRKPLAANYKEIEQVFKNPYLTRSFDKANITTPEAVLSRMLLSPQGLSYLVRSTAPNTDDLNVLEYRIGKTYESVTFGQANGIMLSENMGTPSKYVDWGDLPKEKVASIMAHVAIEATKFGHLTAAYSWARSSLDTAKNSVAQRILFWLEEEDKKRTAAARAQGAVRELELDKPPKGSAAEKILELAPSKRPLEEKLDQEQSKAAEDKSPSLGK